MKGWQSSTTIDGSIDLHYSAIVAINSFAPRGVPNKMMQAGEQGYDAIAIGCFLDPASQEARELLKIKCSYWASRVFSPSACMATNSPVSHSTPSGRGTTTATRASTGWRFATSFSETSGLISTKCRILSLAGGTCERFIKEARRLASQGAEVIIAACVTVNAIICRENFNEVDDVLVLDRNADLLKTHETMAELSRDIGLSASRRLLLNL